MGKVVHFWCIYYIIRHISTNIFIFLYIDTYLTFHEYFSITICLILFIDCNTPDDSVLYNIVQNAMADDSFHDQIIKISDHLVLLSYWISKSWMEKSFIFVQMDPSGSLFKIKLD